jgi:Cu/Ag efflux protein CusF
MPTKLRASVKQVDRNTKKVTIQHSYMKQTPKKELFEMLNKEFTPNKLKQKIRNELVRRGIEIVYVDKVVS